MFYCSKCVMPDTRPGLMFQGDTCQACINHETDKNVDWQQRRKELDDLVSKTKGYHPKYDCVIGVSGGKDSYFLTNFVVNELKLNPLLIRFADPYTMSEAARFNIENLINIFNTDFFTGRIPDKLYKSITRASFEEFANFPYVDYLIYKLPILCAEKLGIRLVFFAENPSYLYGTSAKDDYFVDINKFQEVKDWLWKEFSIKKLSFYNDQMTQDLLFYMPYNVTPIYMSYFVPWSGHQNYLLAKSLGFKELEFERRGYIENYDSLDSLGWGVSQHLKYIKFGFSRATDIACRWIRDGLVTRKWAIEKVNENDHLLDERILKDFLEITGFSKKEFFEVVDKFANKKILEKRDGLWMKKKEYQLSL